MTNYQGYGVYWDDIDLLTGRELKLHRYFNTLDGANTFANALALDSRLKPRVLLRSIVPDEQMDAAERALVEKLNRDELTRLMLQYGFTIRAKDFSNWRPTQRAKGNVPGVWETVELIATDGLLGMFLNDRTEPIVGHIQMFSGGKPKPLFSIEPKDKPKVKKPRKLSKRQQILQTM